MNAGGVVGVQLGHRHTAIVLRRGDELPPGHAALLTRGERESIDQYKERIVAKVRQIGRGAPVVVAGLPLGAAGPKVQGDLARLRDLHAGVHAALPDAVVAGKNWEGGGPESSAYPKALGATTAPKWLRKANQHPKRSREPFRAAWRVAGSMPSPAPSVPTVLDRAGRIPASACPAGQPVGGGQAADAGSAPVGHPTYGPEVDTPQSGGAQVQLRPAAARPSPAVTPTETIRPYGPPPELRRSVTTLHKTLDRRGADFAHARRRLLDAFHTVAAAELAHVSALAARQRLPRHVRLEERQDPRPLGAPTVLACEVEDRAEGRAWWRRRVAVGERREVYLAELLGADWNVVTREDIRKRPTAHKGRPRVKVVRGRWEPTRLLVILLAGAALALAAVVVAVVVRLAMYIALAVLVLSLMVARRKPRARRRVFPGL